jgi:hypothetical protein
VTRVRKEEDEIRITIFIQILRPEWRLISGDKLTKNFAGLVISVSGRVWPAGRQFERTGLELHCDVCNPLFHVHPLLHLDFFKSSKRPRFTIIFLLYLPWNAGKQRHLWNLSCKIASIKASTIRLTRVVKQETIFYLRRGQLTGHAICLLQSELLTVSLNKPQINK